MSKTYRMTVVLLSAAVVVVMSSSQSAVAQRIKVGGGSNQGSKDKKDKDSDDDHKDKNKDKNQGNQNNQNNQGDNQNNQGGNSSKSGNSNKPGNSNVPSPLQPFIQGGQGKSSQGGTPGQNNQGQGGSNKLIGPNKQGFPGQPLQQQQLQKLKDDDERNKKSLKFGVWKGDQWQGPHKIESWTKVFGNSQQPFSSQWYKDHPQAWKYNSNKSNVWVVATVPGVYTWLGWGSVPQQYQVNYGNVAQFDPSLYGDWYPLGVFSLMTGPDDVGTRVVQMAVDRHGHIAGNYFDMITNANYSISGDVNQQTQRVEWWLNQNQYVHFRASIMRLLQPYGTMTVRLPGGDQYWQFVRLEN